MVSIHQAKIRRNRHKTIARSTTHGEEHKVAISIFTT